jgi:3-phenylpropionate/cinnamic acid dioxygenase small subunit
MSTATASPVQTAPGALRLAPSAVQEFLLHEADLLDRRALDEWLALYTADCTYWVPAEPGDPDPEKRVSLFYDDRSILEDRIWRLGHPKMYSQNPPARQVRVLSAARVAPEPTEPGRLRTRTKFILFEHRLREQRTFGGEYEHTLVGADAGWRIERKVVRLAGCDTVLWNFGVPL